MGPGAFPGTAQAQGPMRGGVPRVGRQVPANDAPRVRDWPQKSGVARQFREPLVRREPDGRFTPSLPEGWEVSDDATTCALTVRENATWTDGDAFTADDVILTICRMTDASVEGTTTAARMVALRDGEAKAAAGPIGDSAIIATTMVAPMDTQAAPA